MKAVSGTKGAAEAAIASLDMILIASFPAEREMIFQALETARDDGRLPVERIHYRPAMIVFAAETEADLRLARRMRVCAQQTP